MIVLYNKCYTINEYRSYIKLYSNMYYYAQICTVVVKLRKSVTRSSVARFSQALNAKFAQK